MFPLILNFSGEVFTHILRGVSLVGSKSRRLGSEHQSSQAVRMGWVAINKRIHFLTGLKIKVLAVGFFSEFSPPDLWMATLSSCVPTVYPESVTLSS